MKKETDLGQLVIRDLEVVVKKKAVQVQVDQRPWEAKKIQTPNSNIIGRSWILQYHMTTTNRNRQWEPISEQDEYGPFIR